jgi:hypothetical protein
VIVLNGVIYFNLTGDVVVFNCSQIDTEKAALRWENNVMGHSSVTNSVIHHGLSWGVNIKNS